VPFTLLAHQAPVLPLKLWKPAWFSGTALVLGSMAPDIEYVFQGMPRQGLTHSVLGQLTVCLPVTLALAWIVRRCLARPLVTHLPDCGAFHLRDYEALASGRTTATSLAKDVVSALVGSFSHLALDGLTHPTGWAVEAMPVLATSGVVVLGHVVPLYGLLQLALTLVLGAVAVLLLRMIGSRRMLVRAEAREAEARALGPTRVSRLALWLPVLVGTVVGAGVGLASLDLGDLETFLRTSVRAYFRWSGVASVGLVMGCLLSARHLGTAGGGELPPPTG